jgi:hypothetical protein
VTNDTASTRLSRRLRPRAAFLPIGCRSDEPVAKNRPVWRATLLASFRARKRTDSDARLRSINPNWRLGEGKRVTRSQRSRSWGHVALDKRGGDYGTYSFPPIYSHSPGRGGRSVYATRASVGIGRAPARRPGDGASASRDVWRRRRSTSTGRLCQTERIDDAVRWHLRRSNSRAEPDIHGGIVGRLPTGRWVMPILGDGAGAASRPRLVPPVLTVNRRRSRITLVRRLA